MCWAATCLEGVGYASRSTSIGSGVCVVRRGDIPTPFLSLLHSSMWNFRVPKKSVQPCSVLLAIYSIMGDGSPNIGRDVFHAIPGAKKSSECVFQSVQPPHVRQF